MIAVLLVLMTGCYNTQKPAEPVCGSQEMGESLNDLEARTTTAYYLCATSRPPEQGSECDARHKALARVVEVECSGLPDALDQANVVLDAMWPKLERDCQRADNCLAFARASHIPMPPP